MSTVSMIAPKTANPNIDVQTMSQAAKNMARLAVFRCTEHEALRSKAVRAVAYAQEVGELAWQSIPRLTTSLRGLQELEHFETLRDLTQAMGDKSLSAKDRADLQSEYDNLSHELGDAFTRACERFYAEAENLDAKMEDVRNVLLAQRATEALEDERTLMSTVRQEITAKQTARTELETKRGKIVEALDILRQHNVADMFKDYIPDAKSLEGIGVSDPKIEAVKQSVEIAKKILGNVGDGIRYIELADARGALDAKIDTIDQALGELRKRQAAGEPRLADLEAIMKIDSEGKTVLSEAEKMESTWRVFGDELAGGLTSDTSPGTLQKPLARQLAFLEHLAEQYKEAVVT